MSKELIQHSEKLLAFNMIGETGSFHQAARRLNISQPSLSYSMKTLEGALGIQLFYRTTKGVKLTREGQRLYKFSNKWLRELDTVVNELENLESEMVGSLQIGTYDSLAIHLWPQVLKPAQKYFPSLRYSLTTGSSSYILQKLKNHEIDVCIVVEPSFSEEMERHLLYSDQFAFFIANSKSIGDMRIPPPGKPLTIENLKSIPLIYNSVAKTAQGTTLGQIIESQGVETQNVYCMDNFQACAEFVAQGIGFGVLPLRVAQPYLEDKKIRLIRMEKAKSKTFGEHGIYLCHLKNATHHGRIQKFVQFMKEHSQQEPGA